MRDARTKAVIPGVPISEEPQVPLEGELIGPLTATEWCSFRSGADNDCLQCCGDTSNVRESFFVYLSLGATHSWDVILKEALDVLQAHGIPSGPWVDGKRACIDPRIAKLAAWVGMELMPHD